LVGCSDGSGATVPFLGEDSCDLALAFGFGRFWLVVV